MENTDPVHIAMLHHNSRLFWIREMDKLIEQQPPYDCPDDEATKRFESIINSWDRRQDINEKNRAHNSISAIR